MVSDMMKEDPFVGVTQYFRDTAARMGARIEA